jgi:hypothetical protein
MEVKGDN